MTTAAAIHNNEACVFIIQNCNDTAIHLLNNALVAFSEVKSRSPPQAVPVMHYPRSQHDGSCRHERNYASQNYLVESDFGGEDMNMTIFATPLSICERRAGNDGYQLSDEATIFYNLGIAYAQTGKEAEARFYFSKSFGIQSHIQTMLVQQSNNDDDATVTATSGPSLYAICCTIGHSYRRSGHYADAVSFYEHALEIRPTLEIFSALRNIGLMYEREGELDCAASIFECTSSFLRRMQLHDGQQHAQARSAWFLDPNLVVLNLIALAYVQYKRSLVFLSIPPLLEALEISTTSRGIIPNCMIVDLCMNIAVVYRSIGGIDQALQFYKEALCLELQEWQQQTINSNDRQQQQQQEQVHPDPICGSHECSSCPNHSEKIAGLHRVIGQILLERGDLDEAFAYLDVASKMYLANIGAMEENDAYQLFRTLGDLYLQMGEMDKAVESFSVAMRICATPEMILVVGTRGGGGGGSGGGGSGGGMSTRDTSDDGSTSKTCPPVAAAA